LKQQLKNEQNVYLMLK